MRCMTKEFGDSRFMMWIWMDSREEGHAFKRWMMENYPECMCEYRFNHGVNPHWEVRGGDITIPTVIRLTWQ